MLIIFTFFWSTGDLNANKDTTKCSIGSLDISTFSESLIEMSFSYFALKGVYSVSSDPLWQGQERKPRKKYLWLTLPECFDERSWKRIRWPFLPARDLFQDKISKNGRDGGNRSQQGQQGYRVDNALTTLKLRTVSDSGTSKQNVARGKKM